MPMQKRTYYSEDEAVVEVGHGWERLVRKIYAEANRLGISPDITTVKEKFGGLRVYTDQYNQEFDAVIIAVEKESFSICEECGMGGHLRSNGGVYRTYCDAHSKGHPIVYNPFYDY